MALKRKFVQCSTLLRRSAVRREAVDGVEHIVVESYTLPDNIVMNGGLYPAEEIASSFQSLERTLAPVEHPQDKDGNFIPASDPEAIHNFYAGAYNTNVSRVDGRVRIEKRINVIEALKTERGRRLLDRIAELETNAEGRPIHTSVGVFLEVEPIPEPKTNAAGLEYSWIARNMVFDHDAILLDSIAAAQPHQGVGMAVNAAGERVEVERVTVAPIVNTVKAATGLPLAPSGRTWDGAAADKRVRAAIGAEDAPNADYARYHLWYDAENAENFGAYKLPFVDIIDGRAHAVPAALRNAAARLSQTQGPSRAEKDRIKNVIDGYLEKLRANQSMSVTELYQAVAAALERSAIQAPAWIEELFESEVIFSTEKGTFSVPYRLDGERATIVGIPVPVERKVTYSPVTNQKGDEAMKEMILNALKSAGVETDGLSDEQLMAKYDELRANQSHGAGAGASADGGALAAVVANALQPLVDKVEALEGKLNQKTDEEKAELAGLVANSGKYPGLDEESAKLLGLDKLRELAANCGASYGVPLSVNIGNGNGGKHAPAEMPE